MAGIIKSIVAAAALVDAAVPARADKASEIDGALRTVFGSNDADRDGRLGTAEITHFVNDLFAAMDTNGDRLVSHREFRELSLSLLPLARKYGRLGQYAAARERIWRRWTLGRRKTLSAVNLQLNAKGELFAVPGVGQTVSFEQFKRARFIRELAAAVR
jgi:hypothetical protein